MNAPDPLERLRQAWHVLLHGMPSPRPAPTSQPDGAPPPRRPAGSGSPGEVPETTLRLIALRDHLQLGEDEDARFARAIAAVDRRVVDILALDGTAAFEDTGSFDPERQQVVNTVETDDPGQHYHVVTTVRPGYVRGGALCRRQDVVVFRLPGEQARARS
jgi:GrpE